MKKLYETPKLETLNFETHDFIAAISGFVESEGIEDGGEASE